MREERERKIIKALTEKVDRYYLQNLIAFAIKEDSEMEYSPERFTHRLEAYTFLNQVLAEFIEQQERSKQLLEK